jgi:hypothetical protein
MAKELDTADTEPCDPREIWTGTEESRLNRAFDKWCKGDPRYDPSVRGGRHAWGQHHNRRRAARTKDRNFAILAALKAGRSPEDIAAQHNISASRVSQIASAFRAAGQLGKPPHWRQRADVPDQIREE